MYVDQSQRNFVTWNNRLQSWKRHGVLGIMFCMSLNATLHDDLSCYTLVALSYGPTQLRRGWINDFGFWIKLDSMSAVYMI